MKQIKLNLGCGQWLHKGWINVDKYYTLEQLKSKKGLFKTAIVEKGSEYVRADILKLPFSDEYADVVEMHQVLEHIYMSKVIPVLKEVHRVMKPKAKLTMSVPLFTGLVLDWLKMVTSHDFDVQLYKDVAEVIFGNQLGDMEGEVHKTPFNQQFMNYVLNSAGFTNGGMYIIPRGEEIPQVGELMCPPIQEKEKAMVARNDLLIVEAIK